LSEKYRPAPEIEAEDAVFKVHHLDKRTDLIPKLEINLSKFKSNEEKDNALNEFIMERAAESKYHYEKFYSLIKKICVRNNGFGMKAGLKIQSLSQKTALLRIKEKMLKDLYNNEKKLENEMSSSKLRDTSKKSGTIKEAVEE
jgi:hypothetical protein